MRDHPFDRLARNASGSGVSRRSLLRGTLGAIAVSALPIRWVASPSPARAAGVTSCNCDGYADQQWIDCYNNYVGNAPSDADSVVAGLQYGMAHTAAWRRSLSSDETDHWFFDVCLYVGGRFLFRVAADFADHDDSVRIGIVIEHFNRVEERSANDGIAADADARRLPDAEARELIERLLQTWVSHCWYFFERPFTKSKNMDCSFSVIGPRLPEPM